MIYLLVLYAAGFNHKLFVPPETELLKMHNMLIYLNDLRYLEVRGCHGESQGSCFSNDCFGYGQFRSPLQLAASS